LAARVGQVLQLPHVEIDALFHGPDWTVRPSFEADVRRLAGGDAWVTEWQYSQVRPLLAARAELLVWLDLGRWRVMRQVGRRTVRRSQQRQVLWNGNVEPPLWTVFTDPEHVVRWAWATHHESAQRVSAVLDLNPDLTVIRLPTRLAVEHWVEGPLQRTSVRCRSRA